MAKPLAPVATDSAADGSIVHKVPILGRDTIVVGSGLTDYMAKDLLSTTKSSTFIVVTDHNLVRVGSLARVVAALEKEIAARDTAGPAGSGSKIRVLTFVVPPGEAAKTRSTKERIEDFCLAHKCTRDSCFIALGGGVIGDMIGFVAATYMRGATIVQVPTTMLAMVDSSVGGKTAVDVPSGKNLIGAFHQPHRVYIDIEYLRTLPPRQFINGFGEIIKTAAIWSERDFALLERSAERVLNMAQVEDPNGSEKVFSKDDQEMIIELILGSVRMKAYVVSNDEKESDMRGLLNFGHTIGHSVEAILTPQVLHGEAVSIGMVYESQLARYLGVINDAAVGRLFRCLQSYGLPTSPFDKSIRSFAPGKVCKVDDLMEIMKVDKKNKGSSKRIVLLSKIGDTHEPKASAVEDEAIRFVLSHSAQVEKLVVEPQQRETQHISLAVPGSKSISNRALVLAALGEGECRIKGLLQSDDVQVMLDALQSMLGIEFTWLEEGEILVIQGAQGKCKLTGNEIYLGNAGTAARFLTTVCTLVESKNNQPTDKAIVSGIESTIITGNARMKQRPIGPLVTALRENGVNVEYLESEGSLPLEIPSGGLPGGVINLSATVSSQYVSSILISAPYAKTPVTLSLGTDKVISQTYIDMTIAMMETFGIKVTRDPGTNVYHIPQGVYKNPKDYLIEADASSSTYPLAYAAITGTKVTVTNIGSNSLQGDADFAIKVLNPMGCEVEQTATTTTVKGPERLSPIKWIDMETMTDAFLTATVLAAVADGTTSIEGIDNQRVKECDRIAAMVEQLAFYGVQARELPDGIQIDGIEPSKLVTPPNGTKCYDDHRIAMSFSLLAIKVGAVIKEKACTQKTWPGWWDVMNLKLNTKLVGSQLGFKENVEIPMTKSVVGSSNTNVKVKKAINHATTPIVLIGMRGAGKTHVGQIFAQHLNREFIDMDHYMEKKLIESQNGTIKEFVANKGWPAFREFEEKSLEEVLVAHSAKSNSPIVISCGGGVVESGSSRNLLKTKIKEFQVDPVNGKGAIVVHVRRNIKEVLEYLNADVTRPAYGESIEDVWARRESWYDECSQFEFISAHEDPNQKNWIKVKNDSIKFIDFITGSKNSKSLKQVDDIISKYERFILASSSSSSEMRCATESSVSTFLCPPLSHVSELAQVVDEVTEFTDAIEIRVDLLKDRENVQSVGEQVFLLKRMTNLPIVFTVRTKDQAGTFPDIHKGDNENAAKLKLELLTRAIKWGVEILDVELDQQLPEVSKLAKNTNTLILGSYHDVTGRAVWDESQTKSMGAGAQDVKFGRGIDSPRFLDKFLQLYEHSDMIKLVGSAMTVEDNYALFKFVKEIKETTSGSGIKPLIAINMRAHGRLSRVANEFMTPVTHAKYVQGAVAPGQISVTDINRFRCELLGAFEQKKFYLFGSPVMHSPSPKVHNYGFEKLGVSQAYKYESFDTTDVKKVIDLVKKDPNFGGANVTIPLKQEIIKCGQILDSVSESAKTIGAINTLIHMGTEKTADGVTINKIRGDNTDWIAIAELTKSQLDNQITNNDSINQKIGIVLGAGGTSRAAIYALKNIGIDTVIVVNRTIETAQLLATEFNVNCAQDTASAQKLISEKIGANGKFHLVVVGTIPAAAQESSGIVTSLEKDVVDFFAPKINGSVVVELAYKPMETALLKMAASKKAAKVYGYEILALQGQHSFHYWTGVFPPTAGFLEIVKKSAVVL